MDEKHARFIKTEIDKLVEDIKLRSEFEFDQMWNQMDHSMLGNIPPKYLEVLRNVMRHGYLSGAEAAVLIILEKVAEEMCE